MAAIAVLEISRLPTLSFRFSIIEINEEIPSFALPETRPSSMETFNESYRPIFLFFLRSRIFSTVFFPIPLGGTFIILRMLTESS